MAFRFDDPMTLLAANFAGLNGSVVVCGMATRNLDATRDRCVLHLHTRTGGLVVTRNEDCTYLPPGAISNVELAVEAPADALGTPLASSEAPLASSVHGASDAPSSSSTQDVDRILAELTGDDVAAAPEPTQQTRRRRGPKPAP